MHISPKATHERFQIGAMKMDQMAVNELSAHMFWGRLPVIHPNSIGKVRGDPDLNKRPFNKNTT